jgi:hypothetical protein
MGPPLGKMVAKPAGVPFRSLATVALPTITRAVGDSNAIIGEAAREGKDLAGGEGSVGDNEGGGVGAGIEETDGFRQWVELQARRWWRGATIGELQRDNSRVSVEGARRRYVLLSVREHAVVHRSTVIAL